MAEWPKKMRIQRRRVGLFFAGRRGRTGRIRRAILVILSEASGGWKHFWRYPSGVQRGDRTWGGGAFF